MKEEDLRRVEREMSRVKDLEKKRGRVALALNRGKHLNPSLVESSLVSGRLGSDPVRRGGSSR